ncbi:hypothetical protein J1614_011145 [Plenodomus biglobosus]|nr:hypothetical protein J1614_011145 [Plenodomus biglobosus]
MTILVGVGREGMVMTILLEDDEDVCVLVRAAEARVLLALEDDEDLRVLVRAVGERELLVVRELTAEGRALVRAVEVLVLVRAVDDRMLLRAVVGRVLLVLLKDVGVLLVLLKDVGVLLVLLKDVGVLLVLLKDVGVLLSAVEDRVLLVLLEDVEVGRVLLSALEDRCRLLAVIEGRKLLVLVEDEDRRVLLILLEEEDRRVLLLALEDRTPAPPWPMDDEEDDKGAELEEDNREELVMLEDLELRPWPWPVDEDGARDDEAESRVVVTVLEVFDLLTNLSNIEKSAAAREDDGKIPELLTRTEDEGRADTGETRAVEDEGRADTGETRAVEDEERADEERALEGVPPPLSAPAHLVELMVNVLVAEAVLVRNLVTVAVGLKTNAVASYCCSVVVVALEADDVTVDVRTPVPGDVPKRATYGSGVTPPDPTP